MILGVNIISTIGIIMYIAKLVLIIWGMVWLIKYFKRSSEEKRLLRMELSKLADEVRQIRQELKADFEKKGSE